MGLGSFKKKIQPGFVLPVFTYPRPLAKKLRAMEKTNELPEEAKKNEDPFANIQERITIQVLENKLQSKEEEVAKLTKQYTELETILARANSSQIDLREQLKAKDEQLTKFRAVVEKLAAWSKNYPRGPIYPYSAKVNEQLISIENEAIELVSLLSQSTDKP